MTLPWVYTQGMLTTTSLWAHPDFRLEWMRMSPKTSSTHWSHGHVAGMQHTHYLPHLLGIRGLAKIRLYYCAWTRFILLFFPIPISLQCSIFNTVNNILAHSSPGTDWTPLQMSLFGTVETTLLAGNSGVSGEFGEFKGCLCIFAHLCLFWNWGLFSLPRSRSTRHTWCTLLSASTI